MANEYYDSILDDDEIEAALVAINGLISPLNNGKAIAVENGKLVARSVQWGGGGGSTIIAKPDTVTQNGTYYASTDSADGYSEFTVDVPSATLPSANGVSF